nr:MAG TPA: hypothetical protein [Caudoviricetes sp.]
MQLFPQTAVSVSGTFCPAAMFTILEFVNSAIKSILSYKYSGGTVAPPLFCKISTELNSFQFGNSCYCYSVLAVAGAAIPILIRCGNGESRNRAGVVIGKLPAHIGFQRFILRSLTCGKLCSKKLLALLCNLGILSFNALRRQRVKHRAGVGVLILDDVPRAVLDSLARVAGLRSKVVIYALNRFAGFAAAIGLLHCEAVPRLWKFIPGSKSIKA